MQLGKERKRAASLADRLRDGKRGGGGGGGNGKGGGGRRGGGAAGGGAGRAAVCRGACRGPPPGVPGSLALPESPWQCVTSTRAFSMCSFLGHGPMQVPREATCVKGGQCYCIMNCWAPIKAGSRKG